MNYSELCYLAVSYFGSDLAALIHLSVALALLNWLLLLWFISISIQLILENYELQQKLISEIKQELCHNLESK